MSLTQGQLTQVGGTAALAGCPAAPPPGFAVRGMGVAWALIDKPGESLPSRPSFLPPPSALRTAPEDWLRLWN